MNAPKRWSVKAIVGDLVREPFECTIGTWKSKRKAEKAAKGMISVLQDTKPDWCICEFWVEEDV